VKVAVPRWPLGWAGQDGVVEGLGGLATAQACRGVGVDTGEVWVEVDFPGPHLVNPTCVEFVMAHERVGFRDGRYLYLAGSGTTARHSSSRRSRHLCCSSV